MGENHLHGRTSLVGRVAEGLRAALILTGCEDVEPRRNWRERGAVPPPEIPSQAVERVMGSAVAEQATQIPEETLPPGPVIGDER
jgi:hypothetical protein